MTRIDPPTPLRRLAASWPLAALAFVVAVLPPDTSPEPRPAGQSGFRIAIDPETGDLIGMPPADDAFSLDQALSRSSAGLVPVRRPDGSVSVHLQGRFMSASVVRLEADGTVKTLCTDDLEQAERFLAGEDTDHDHAHDHVEWEVQ